ncbi:MAG TPA: hypothetical protein VH413_18115 [Verrucomicrobiae bacterium]|jgi:hypothetical protein|nr:hypothetical protein [Verrucomicrobiae bacterium]
MNVVIARRVLSFCLALFCTCGIAATAFAHDVRLRIVTYNIEDDINGATAPLPGLITPFGSTNVLLGGVLEGIGEETLGTDKHAQPLDIIALEETTSNPVTVQPIVNGLNAFYGTNRYALSTFQATESGGDTADGNGPNAIAYNTATVQLVASVPVNPTSGSLGSSSGEYRQVMRYEFAPAGVTPAASNVFYIYVSHYKSGTTASDLTSRGKEAVIIRNDEAASLPANARVVYVGDYNVTTSGEASYITILATNSPSGIAQGGGYDFSNPTGSTNVNWGTSTLLALKTESTTDLRYRDDFQIMTSNVFFGVPGGLSLVTNTYHVFGNNGSTPFQGNVSTSDSALNSSIPAGSPITAATLYHDLTNASDHLPVVADYTVTVPDPAPYQAWQLQYFGCTNCAQAQTNADGDGTGQNNYFKFVAGLNPTNPASVFTFQITPGTNLSAGTTLAFGPAMIGRTYTPQVTTDLESGVWQSLTNLAVTPVTNSSQVSFTDTNTAAPQQFYRIGISLQ